MVRRRKPDIMTLLVIAVAVGVITTTTVQANETSDLSRILGMSTCITLPEQAPACVTLNTIVNGTTSNGMNTPSGNVSEYEWSEPSIKRAELLASATFVPFKESRCSDRASFNSQQITGSDELTEMRIDLNNYLGLDVGMRGDFINASVSSIYLGFKDCW